MRWTAGWLPASFPRERLRKYLLRRSRVAAQEALSAVEAQEKQRYEQYAAQNQSDGGSEGRGQTHNRFESLIRCHLVVS